MKHKSISKQSGRLLSFFNEQARAYFNHTEALTAFPESKQRDVNGLLIRMAQKGLLIRLKEGVYYIIPPGGDAASFTPDRHLIARHLVRDASHYIGYYSALQLHHLTTQPLLKEQIVVSKQLLPAVIKIKDVSFQLIHHSPHHFFGIKRIGIDNSHKVQCSDLEKTIIDCLFRPGYAGGIVEIARAIYISRNQIEFDKLLRYIKKFKSQAVLKRLGFLLELLDIDAPITEELLRLKTASFVLLDTSLPRSGRWFTRWSVQQNVETETIKSAIAAA